MFKRRSIAVWCGLALLLGTAPAFADTTYYFSGLCSDCSGEAYAQLVLSNYTLGQPLTAGNLNFFMYDGTNLVSEFDTGGPIDSINSVELVSGGLPAALPAPASLSFKLDQSTNNHQFTFTTDTSGAWSLAYNGPIFDQGTGGVWSATSPVPEPSAAALLGAGLLALLAVRKRLGVS